MKRKILTREEKDARRAEENARNAAKMEAAWAEADAYQAAERRVIRTALQRMIDAGCEAADHQIAERWIATHREK